MTDPPERLSIRRKQGVSSGFRRLAVAGAATACLLLASACATAPEPESTASREVEAARAEAEQEAARQEEEGRQEDRRRRPEPDPVREKLIVVSPGGQAAATSVAELSRATRAERQRHGDRSVGELTDENLPELSKRGEVTFAGDGSVEEAGGGEEGATADGEASAEDATVADAEAETPCDETCWRRRAYELRQAWNEATDEVARLEEEAADLRWRFYAEDDPWVRDSQIKPAWDRVLDRLGGKRDEAERYAERVAELMERGRRAGALPGWLREGVELEPQRPDPYRKRDNPRQPTSVEPMEPTVVDEGSEEPDEQD